MKHLSLAEKIWFESAVPIFLERFILPVLAAAVIGLTVLNPLNLDWQRRLALAIGATAFAYFVAVTLYVRIQGPVPEPDETLSPVELPPVRQPQPPSGQPRPFRVAVGPTITTAKGRSIFFIRSAAGLHNVHFMPYVQLVNLQDITCEIESLIIQIGPFGDDWSRLTRAPPGVLYLVTSKKGFKRASELEADDLIANLTDRRIEPREMVEGWMFLRYPPGMALPLSESLEIKVTISDTAGLSWTDIVPPGLKSGGEDGEGLLDRYGASVKIVRTDQDLSGLIER